MDYEKAYKEALERAKQIEDNPYTAHWDVMKETVEYVFPGLRESENERIRKALIRFHKSTIDVDGIKGEDIIAWLEKQGEHAKFRESIQIGDEVTRNKDGMLVNLSQLKRVAKPNESKQGEQKAKYHDVCDKCVRQPTCQSDCFLQQEEQMPAENKGMNLVEEEMTPFQKKVFCIIDTTIEEEQGLKQVCDELLRLAHDEIMQTPAEWSEEDKKILDDIIDSGKHACFLTVKQTEWLETLKDRVQPQTKYEWSDDDEKFVHGLIRGLAAKRDIHGHTTFSSDCIDITKTINWLKSLRPQNRWKLSDEQIKKELDKAANEWEYKASFSPIAMVMDGDRPIDTKQHITSHADSFKAGVDWIIKKLKGE